MDSIGDVVERIKKNNPWTDAELEKHRDDHAGFLDNHQYKISRVPEKYTGVSLPDWKDYTPERRDIKQIAIKMLFGDAIQMWAGPTGTGKTMLSYCLMQRFNELYKKGINDNWHYIQSLFASHRTINQIGQEKSPALHIQDYSQYHFLVIDDYNNLENSQMIIKGLFDLIKIREAAGLKTLLISNMKPDALVNSFGEFWDMIDNRMQGKGCLIDFSKCGEWIE